MCSTLLAIAVAATALAVTPSQQPSPSTDKDETALAKKKVPVVVVVADKASAEFELTGHSESVKATTAKKIFLGSFHSDEQASIQVADLASGEVVFAYSVNKANSAHGKKSTAEACAKHLKEEIEKKK